MANNLAERVEWHAAQKLTLKCLQTGFLSTFRFTLLALNDFDYLDGSSQIDDFFDSLSIGWQAANTRDEAETLERSGHIAPEVGMQPNGPTVYLVSCVSQKREQACAARDLYVSDLFCKARRFAEASGCPWFIPSAEHGLIAPGQVIAPYERTLNTMRAADRRAWGERVAAQLAEAVPDLSRVVFLAGERYREFLARHLASRGVQVSVPMEGLRIAEQLSWLGSTRLSPPSNNSSMQRTALRAAADAERLVFSGLHH